MNQTAWGAFVWTEEPAEGGGTLATLTVGPATIGCVFWWRAEGPFLPYTTVRRFTAVGDIGRAKALVEETGLLDLLTYPTFGNA